MAPQRGVRVCQMRVGYTGTMGLKANTAIWISRVLVATVFLVNVQCAVQFIIWPDAYTAAYQVEGASAEVMVRTVGICFLMWNATYPPVIAHPTRYRVLFGVVIAQQLVGLIGESALLLTLEPGLEVLASSIMRFIAFDAAGLVLLVIAFALTLPHPNPRGGA